MEKMQNQSEQHKRKSKTKRKIKTKSKSSKKQIQYIQLYDNLYVVFWLFKALSSLLFCLFLFFLLLFLRFFTCSKIRVTRSPAKEKSEKQKNSKKKCGNKKRPHINVYWICFLFCFSFAFVFFEIVTRCVFFLFLRFFQQLCGFLSP